MDLVRIGEDFQSIFPKFRANAVPDGAGPIARRRDETPVMETVIVLKVGTEVPRVAIQHGVLRARRKHSMSLFEDSMPLRPRTF